MTMHWLRLEWRLLTRDHGAWVILGLFAVALIYGLGNGARVAQQQRETASALTKDAAA
jgi:hypothetical protein